jgi:arginine exporter protein ArgO
LIPNEIYLRDSSHSRYSNRKERNLLEFTLFINNQQVHNIRGFLEELSLSGTAPDEQVFNALLKHYELLREERSGSESREIEATTIVIAVFLVILPVGVEFHVEEVFLLMPFVFFVGFIFLLWSRLNYEMKSMAVLDVQKRMEHNRMVNAFDIENRLHDSVRSKMMSTFIVPLSALNILIMLFSLYLGFQKLITNPDLGLLGLFFLSIVYGGLLVVGLILKSRWSEAIHVLKQIRLPKSTGTTP